MKRGITDALRSAALAALAVAGLVPATRALRHKRLDPRESRWVTSIFAMKVYGPDGRVKREWTYAPNLRTTAGLNWQADVMGNPVQPAAARYIALTADATAPAAGDTALAGELTANGYARAAGTYAHTAGATTYTISNTFTATGVATINKVGLFNAAGPPPAGTLVFESAEPNPPTLAAGDTLAQTVTVSI